MSSSPAGWQPDPRGRHEYRYWDGTQWTDHVSDKGQMSSDPVANVTPPAPEPVVPAAATSESTAPGGVSAGAPAPFTASADTAPPRATPARPTDQAKATLDEALHGKSPELATILSVVVPGSGHLYMGVDDAKRPLAFGLIGATVAYFVLSYFSFLLFIVGLVIWIGAAAFALTDLRGGVKGLENTKVPPRIVALLMIAGGGLLIFSLVLPFYQANSVSVSGFVGLRIIDIVLLVIGVAAIVAGFAALGLGPVSAGDLPRAMPLAVAVGAAAAAVLIAYRMIFPSGLHIISDLGRGPGILLALDAALILLLANASVLRSASARR